MDLSAQRLAEVETSLAQATAFERYQEAADLKRKADLLNSADVVEEVMQARLLTWYQLTLRQTTETF